MQTMHACQLLQQVNAYMKSINEKVKFHSVKSAPLKLKLQSR